MVFEFKTTNKNTYGHRKYLAIDTDNKTYTTDCPNMIVTGIEIRTADYRSLIDDLEKNGFERR